MNSRDKTSVWCLAFSQFVALGTLQFSFSLFVTPMQVELGWSPTEINGALTAGLLTAGAVSYPVGRWIDKHGPGALLPLSALAGAGLLALWSTVESLATFYLLWVGLGLVIATSVNDPVFTILAKTQRDFKTAITRVAVVGGLASTAFVPLYYVLLESFGWRGALFGLALLHLAIPGVLNFVQWAVSLKRPFPATAPFQADKIPVTPFRTVARSMAFWILAITFAAHAFFYFGIIFHFVPMMQFLGLETASILLALAALGPAMVLGRLALLVVPGHVPIRRVGRLVIALHPVAAASLLAIPTLGFAALATHVVALGLAAGALTIVRTVGIAEVIGNDCYGATAGAISGFMATARTVSPLAIAVLAEASSYLGAAWLLLAVSLLGAVTLWLLPPAPVHGQNRTMPIPPRTR